MIRNRDMKTDVRDRENEWGFNNQVIIFAVKSLVSKMNFIDVFARG
jgi:hypothetical protein